MARLALTTAFVVASFAGAAHADQFLGIEKDPNGTMPPAASEDEDDAEPAATDRAKPSATRRARRGSSYGPDAGDVTFGFGLGAADGAIGPRLSIGYSFNRYLGVDLSGHYTKHEHGAAEGEEWGPNVDAVLRYPNPTVLTPFAGAGPGFLRWQRRYKDEVYDAGDAFLTSGFIGLNIRLAGRFGIQAVRRQTIFLTQPPLVYNDSDRNDPGREPYVAVANQIGFSVAF